MSRSVLSSIAALLVGAAPLAAQTLVRDFDTTPVTTPASSGPSEFRTLPGGLAFFRALQPGAGSEPWISDGTVGGTSLLLDGQPGPIGSSPYGFAQLANGTLLYSGWTAATGYELWRSDGTPAGTNLVLDVAPGPTSSSLFGLVAVGNDAYFFADDGTNGFELWRSDGTAAGTVLAVEFGAGPAGIEIGFGGAWLGRLGTTNDFLVSAANGGQRGLWRSDGTTAGTSLLSTFGTGIQTGIQGFTPLAGGTLFLVRTTSGSEEVWFTDGTAAGTIALGASSDGPFQVVGGVAYFGALQAGGGALQEELWRTDGTVAGTYQVVDLVPTSAGVPIVDPAFLGSLGNSVVFVLADDGFDGDLWISDGTAAGTLKLGEVGHFWYPFPDLGVTFGGELYFAGALAGANGLWKTDGTAAGTVLVSPMELTLLQGAVVGGTLVFGGYDQANGYEPWITDGTAAGTQLLLDVNPTPLNEGSVPIILLRHRDLAIVHVDDGVVGEELWVSDGTPAGTQLLLDAEPGPTSSFPRAIASNGALLFATMSPNAFPFPARDPWISDGTPAGTSRLPLGAVFPGFTATAAAAFRDGFLLRAETAATGSEPWFTDGTVGGTVALGDLVPGPAGSTPDRFYAWNDLAFFVADGASGTTELWVTDGTPGGTTSLSTGTSSLDDMREAEFQAFGDFVYFANDPYAVNSNSELWRSDGTLAGTGPFLELTPGPAASTPHDFHVIDGRLLFQATVAGVPQLVSTGATAGSVTFPGVLPGFIFRVLPVNDDVALVDVHLGAGIGEFYLTDGLTLAGPLPDPLRPGTRLDRVGDDVAVFGKDDLLTGSELWRTDGTPAGTSLLFDLAPDSSDPVQSTRIGDVVLFTADDGIHGRELFAFPLDLVGDEAVEPYGYGSPGSNGTVPTLDVVGEADASSAVAFSLVVEDAAPTTPVFLLWSRVAAATPLAGCTLWIGGNVMVSTATSDASGTATYPFVPNVGLAGQRFVSQAFPFDPGGAALGVASATAGLEVVIGP